MKKLLRQTTVKIEKHNICNSMMQRNNQLKQSNNKSSLLSWHFICFCSLDYKFTPHNYFFILLSSSFFPAREVAKHYFLSEHNDWAIYIYSLNSITKNSLFSYPSSLWSVCGKYAQETEFSLWKWSLWGLRDSMVVKALTLHPINPSLIPGTVYVLLSIESEVAPTYCYICPSQPHTKEKKKIEFLGDTQSS